MVGIGTVVLMLGDRLKVCVTSLLPLLLLRNPFKELSREVCDSECRTLRKRREDCQADEASTNSGKWRAHNDAKGRESYSPSNDSRRCRGP